METLDYSDQGKRPSVRQIIADWRKLGQPSHFAVTYGETYAEFERGAGPLSYSRWYASGNGCEGIKRDSVERALNTGEAS